jgi:hypothetical protein
MYRIKVHIAPDAPDFKTTIVQTNGKNDLVRQKVSFGCNEDVQLHVSRRDEFLDKGSATNGMVSVLHYAVPPCTPPMRRSAPRPLSLPPTNNINVLQDATNNNQNHWQHFKVPPPVPPKNFRSATLACRVFRNNKNNAKKVFEIHLIFRMMRYKMNLKGKNYFIYLNNYVLKVNLYAYKSRLIKKNFKK